MTNLYICNYSTSKPANVPCFSVALSDFDEGQGYNVLMQRYKVEDIIAAGDNVIIAFNKVTKLVVSVDKYADETDIKYHNLYDRNKDIHVFTYEVLLNHIIE